MNEIREAAATTKPNRLFGRVLGGLSGVALVFLAAGDLPRHTPPKQSPPKIERVTCGEERRAVANMIDPLPTSNISDEQLQYLAERIGAGLVFDLQCEEGFFYPTNSTFLDGSVEINSQRSIPPWEVGVAANVPYNAETNQYRPDKTISATVDTALYKNGNFIHTKYFILKEGKWTVKELVENKWVKKIDSLKIARQLGPLMELTFPNYISLAKMIKPVKKAE